MANKISREVAEKEVTDWLDKKKIFTSVRESDAGKANIEDIIGFVMEGIVEINDDGTAKHNLVFPLGDNSVVKDLTYKARINNKLLEPYMKGVSPTDPFAVFLANACAATDTAKGILNALDSGTDKKVMQAIVFFFI